MTASDEAANHIEHIELMLANPNTHFHYSTGRDAVAFLLSERQRFMKALESIRDRARSSQASAGLIDCGQVAAEALSPTPGPRP